MVTCVQPRRVYPALLQRQEAAALGPDLAGQHRDGALPPLQVHLDAVLNQTHATNSDHSFHPPRADLLSSHTAHLSRSRNLQFGLLRRLDDDQRLLLEARQAADVAVRHVGRRARRLRIIIAHFGTVSLKSLSESCLTTDDACFCS